MELEKIKQINDSFNESLLKEEDPVKKLNLMGRYYNWLNESLAEETDVTAKVEIKNNFYKLLYAIAVLLQKNNIKLKGLAEKWNNSLVGRTYKLSKNRSMKDVQELLDDLQAEEDFFTKAYCYFVLQQDGLVDFSKMLVTEKQMRTVQRPCIDGKTVADDGSKYWHTGAKELMTYDECTERGLGHHLLAYPIGHESKHCYVGFYEPDASKVHNPSKEDAEWVDAVLVDAETL